MVKKFNNGLYHRFMDSFVAIFKGAKAVAFDKGNSQWRKLKALGDINIIEKEIDRMVYEFKSKEPRTLFHLWAKKSLMNKTATIEAMPTMTNNHDRHLNTVSGLISTTTSSNASSSQNCMKIERVCHAQLRLQDQIQMQTNELNNIRVLKSSNLLSVEAEKKLKSLEKERNAMQKKLKRLHQLKLAQAKHRRKTNSKLKRLIEKHPESAKELEITIFEHSGQPRLEDRGQSALLDVIVEIASRGAAADSLRRTNLISPCLTLDQLAERLNSIGFTLSRSATYLRLLPRRSNSIEGKRHVQTVPVRLIRANNDGHKQHDDQYFAKATINHLKTLATTFGSQSVFFLSQDDKARVPIGLPAARKQAPLLMHLDYKVLLPDHDFVVAPGHKLIPSVYAACVITDKKELSYSGPTFIAIRSGKHDSSTALSHHNDFSLLFDLPSFESSIRVNGKCKPIVIISVDGGPDENPRYSKTLAGGVELFKKYDLDCLFVVTNCPGRSAFNMVERRMAPLSNQLAGLILPHDYYGGHLDDSGKTIDAHLEVRNFKRAGECLSEVWNELVIDSYPVVSQYIEPPTGNHSETLDVDKLDPAWLAIHVRQSQYLLQIIKCHDSSCCSQWRTCYSKVISDRFLPPPFPFKTSQTGVCCADVHDKEGRFVELFQQLQLTHIIPNMKIVYDRNCPSIQSEIQKRICSQCHLYHPSIAAMKRHKRWHNLKPLKQEANVFSSTPKLIEVIHQDDDDPDEDEPQSLRTISHVDQNSATTAPLIDNIFDFLASDFVEF